MKYEYEQISTLITAPWRTANHVLAPDYRMLKKSLAEYGWLYPVVARVEDRTLIDGFHRCNIAAGKPDLEFVPVIWRDVDVSDAMVMHIQLNRARGQLINRHVSGLVKSLIRGGKYEDEELRDKLGMTLDEFDLLADGTLIKMRNVREHKYSKAWVPVETNSAPAQPVVIERPPNKDQ